MAQLAVFIAGLLLIAASQASDVVDRSKPQGFLSKYMSSGASFAPRAALPATRTVVFSGEDYASMDGPDMRLANRQGIARMMPFLESKQVSSSPNVVLREQAQARRDTSKSPVRDYDKFITATFNHVITNREQKVADKGEDKDVQKLLSNESNKPIGLCAIGVALLSLAAMVGVRLRRGMQPLIALSSSDGHGIDLSIPIAPVSVDNIWDFGSQVSLMRRPEQVLQGSERAHGKDMHADIQSPFAPWDPFGLGEASPEAHVESFRQSELLHGRVAMATVFFVSTTALRQRTAFPLHGKGFGAEAEKPKKKGRSVPTITVDEFVDEEDSAPAAASEGDIFAKYGIDSSGKAPTRAAVPEPEPPFTPLKDVPDDVQVAAEKVLLGGGLLCLTVFVFIGGAITVDAFSVASGQPLDPGMKTFIVDVLEPKFTPTLLAGFACSISLGGLKSLQLTSDDAQYSEGIQYSEDD
jgi:hypothetical protein